MVREKRSKKDITIEYSIAWVVVFYKIYFSSKRYVYKRKSIPVIFGNPPSPRIFCENETYI